MEEKVIDSKWPRKKDSLLNQLRLMEVEEELTFPREKVSYIRTAIYQFGFEWGKKFEARIDRQDGVVRVTRLQ